MKKVNLFLAMIAMMGVIFMSSCSGSASPKEEATEEVATEQAAEEAATEAAVENEAVDTSAPAEAVAQ